ncbi:uncharacterized protein V1510DRAFT_422517 [Dipodascopsis tothii]|uniref:uncharacterized protein n=1 Tax=Dipodascopsis tothii TaxID=44089 RepID=UPI0034D00968
MVLGRSLFAELYYLWLKFDAAAGWTCPQADALLPAIELHHVTDLSDAHRLRSDGAMSRAAPAACAQMHVWLHNVTVRRGQRLHAAASRLRGPNAAPDVVTAADDVAGGYGVYFAAESVYNTFGPCPVGSSAEHQVMSLYHALRVATGVSNYRVNTYVLHTSSRYLCDSFAQLNTWRSRNWKTKDRRPIAHAVYWKSIYDMLQRVNMLYANGQGHTLPVRVEMTPAASDGVVRARRLATIGAERAIYYDMDAETLPPQADLIPGTTVYSPTMDTGGGAAPAVPSADPILDAYRELTGDHEFADGDTDFYVKFNPEGLAECIAGADLQTAWAV